jgi:hypothetical protein
VRTLPLDESRDLQQQALFPREDLWVPVAVVNGNVHILPGVPRLCELFHSPRHPLVKLLSRIVEGLLEGLKAFILPRLVNPEGTGICRILISTPLPESEVAPYLTELAARVEPKGVKVGSYPRWQTKRNTVTLVGRWRIPPPSAVFQPPILTDYFI